MLSASPDCSEGTGAVSGGFVRHSQAGAELSPLSRASRVHGVEGEGRHITHSTGGVSVVPKPHRGKERAELQPAWLQGRELVGHTVGPSQPS